MYYFFIESGDFHSVSLRLESLEGKNIFLSEMLVLSLNILVKSNMNKSESFKNLDSSRAYIQVAFSHAYYY